MKYNVQNLAFLSAVITFASCQQHKQATIDEAGNEVVKIRKPTEDTVIATANTKDATAVDEPSQADAVMPGKRTTSAKPSEKPQINEAVKPASTSGTAKPAKSLAVKGVVKDINRGKDGYTAKIESSSGQIVAATISRSNLHDPKQYRDIAVGDVVKVTGNTWVLDGVSQMTVRILE